MQLNSKWLQAQPLEHTWVAREDAPASRRFPCCVDVLVRKHAIDRSARPRDGRHATHSNTTSRSSEATPDGDSSQRSDYRRCLNSAPPLERMLPAEQIPTSGSARAWPSRRLKEAVAEQPPADQAVQVHRPAMAVLEVAESIENERLDRPNSRRHRHVEERTVLA